MKPRKLAQVSDWLVTENDNPMEYPGIVENKTRMHFGPHPTATSGNDWQIKFSTPGEVGSPPPAVDVMHLVYVKRGRVAGPPVNDEYFDEAVKIITGTIDYYIAVGCLGEVPTLMVLVLQPPSGQSFDLVLVKLQEVGDAGHVEQGGVIHGEA